MSKTHDEIVIDLHKAAQGPLGRRTLAGAVRKGLKLLLELRADHSWEELSAAMVEVGCPVSAETCVEPCGARFKQDPHRQTGRRTKRPRGVRFGSGSGRRYSPHPVCYAAQPAGEGPANPHA